jgi:hypothetical protein
MPDLVNGAAEEEVAQPSVSMAGHGDEVAFFGFGGAEQFLGRVAQSEPGAGADALSVELVEMEFEIGAVGFHFFGLGQREVVEVSRGPTVRDVNQEEFGTELSGQAGDVRKEGFIRTAVFQGDEDFAVHGTA